ncbi:MAG: septal ring lytic transglycosylase RlpA family protein [Chromatiaceae bacterium]|nr:septal ring lytic transglycosylase RlpA family protein [Chromatiaceae bacterium]
MPDASHKPIRARHPSTLATRWFGSARLLAPLLSLMLLAGCASDGGNRQGMNDEDEMPASLAQMPDAVPRIEPKSRYGNPASYVVFGKRYYTKASAEGHVERGLASWYGKDFHGRRTSSGEPYDMYAMTAAHKTLPLPTYARVTNLDNGRSVVVRINDRGPFHHGRVIDLSYAAATKLGVVRQGTAPVEVRAIDPRRSNEDETNLFLAQASEPLPVKAEAETTRVRASAQPAVKLSAAHLETTESGQLFLQVGAFGDPNNAERLRERLTDRLSDPVQIENSERNGLALYKVRIGPLGSRLDADRLSEELTNLGVGGMQLVQN